MIVLKYDFTGFTLLPGQVVPQREGNSIGIRYNDWSTYDKSNDMSYNGSEIMVIFRFIADGTHIYGNDLPDPENPPQPPVVKNSSLGNFAVYSTEFTDIWR